MKLSEFFKTERGFIIGLGTIGGILILFGIDIGLANFWVAGTVMAISSVLLGIALLVKRGFKG